MKISGKILALDLATSTGWAAGFPDELPRFGTHTLPSTGENIATYAWAFDEWLNSILDLELPAFVIFESPVLPPTTTPRTVRKLNGLAYDCEKLCAHKGIGRGEGNVTTIKKFWTGNGRAKKDDMQFEAIQRGLKVHTEHEADACALWAYAVACYAKDQSLRARWLLRGAV